MFRLKQRESQAHWQPAAGRRSLTKTLAFEIFIGGTTDMTHMASQTIRALDIGYGLIKFTRGHLQTDASLDLGSFPTFAELTSVESRDPSKFTVTTKGVRFCMGSESITFSRGTAQQFLEPSFFDSTHCIALALGAVANMKISSDGIVDMLAIGLPTGVMASKSTVNQLQTKLLSEHDVPDFESGVDRKITIRNAKFFGQQAAASHALQTFQQSKGTTPDLYDLHIDAGYVNLSWLIKNEQKTIYPKTSSICGGVTDLIEPMLEDMQPGAFQNLRLRKRLDDAMHNGVPTIKVSGKQFDVTKYFPILEARISENASQILSSLGRIKKIGNVYMSGGGARHYHRKIQELFPEKTIFAPHAMSHFDGVRGLQMLAEMQD